MSCMMNPSLSQPSPRRFATTLSPERRGKDVAVAPSVGLLSLELWFALLVERPHAFETVLGGHGDVVGLDGQRHARLEIGLAAPVDGLLGLAYGHGSVGGNGGGNLESLGARLARRDEMIHEAERLRLRGGHAPAREDHLLGERRADDARQELRASDAGEDAE